MAVARSTNETFDFVCLADRELEPDKQTTFHLRRITNDQQLRLQDLHGSGEQAKLALRAGVAGWTNLQDAEGNQVKPRHESGKRNVCGVIVDRPLTEASLEHLPSEVLFEIAAAVLTGNKLTDEDAKN